MKHRRPAIFGSVLLLAMFAGSFIFAPVRAVADNFYGGFVRDVNNYLDVNCKAGCGTTPTVPSTYTFNAAGQSNIWACTTGQSTFALTAPPGLTGTLTVSVAQTSGGTYSAPPWGYAPGAPAYVSTITNNGSLTITLGSNSYVMVADTTYTSGSVTVTGGCSSAVGYVPPQVQSVAGSAPVTATLSGGVATIGLGIVPITDGGTGSATQNFVGYETNGGSYAQQNVYSPLRVFGNVEGSNTNAAFTIFNQSTTPPSAAIAIATIPFVSAANGGYEASGIVAGISGAGGGTGNYGGYLHFDTKRDGALGAQQFLLGDPQAHIYAPFTIMTATVTTPASCVALVECGTVVSTFTDPFLTPAGGGEPPLCEGVTVQDTTAPVSLWSSGINAVSSTAVTLEYGPLAATSVAHSLTFTFACWDSTY